MHEPVRVLAAVITVVYKLAQLQEQCAPRTLYECAFEIGKLLRNHKNDAEAVIRAEKARQELEELRAKAVIAKREADFAAAKRENDMKESLRLQAKRDREAEEEESRIKTLREEADLIRKANIAAKAAALRDEQEKRDRDAAIRRDQDLAAAKEAKELNEARERARREEEQQRQALLRRNEQLEKMRCTDMPGGAPQQCCPFGQGATFGEDPNWRPGPPGSFPTWPKWVLICTPVAQR